MLTAGSYEDMSPSSAVTGRELRWVQYHDYREKMLEHYKKMSGGNGLAGNVPRCEAAKKLVLRASAELESDRIGDIPAGRHLIVLEEAEVEGTVRVRVGNDSTPRGVIVHSLGWVTAVKDGEWKVAPSNNKDGSTPSWSLCGVAASSATIASAQRAEDSSATRKRPTKGKRKAKTSRDANRAFMARSQSEMELTGEVSPGASASSDFAHSPGELSPGERSKKRPLLSCEALEKVVESMQSDATNLETKNYETMGSRLGWILLTNNIKVEVLMVEWDRNRDGSISKQEFRLNVRKLGIDGSAASTAELDKLYDSIDVDGSGDLDTDEMTTLLNKLQNEARDSAEQKKRAEEKAALSRDVVEVYLQAIEVTKVYEAEKAAYDNYERCAQGDLSPAAGLVKLFKQEKVNLAELKGLDANNFAARMQDLGAQFTDQDLDDLWRVMDPEGTRTLSGEGLKLSLVALSSKLGQKDAVAGVQKTKKLAESAQLEAQRAQEKVEAEQAETEASAKRRADERRESIARAKADEKAAKEQLKEKLAKNAMGKFMQ